MDIKQKKEILSEEQKELDFKFMQEAINEANKAYLLSEIPIGAVVVCDKKIIGRGHNLKENNKNSILHAEIIAINQATEYLDKWRLDECTIYVNLEPCVMCAGAIINSRIKRVVFACFDKKSGAFGSVINVNDIELNHKVELTTGVMEKEAKEIIQNFFKELRDGKQRKF